MHTLSFMCRGNFIDSSDLWIHREFSIIIRPYTVLACKSVPKRVTWRADGSWTHQLAFNCRLRFKIWGCIVSTALQAFRTPKNAFSGPDWHPWMHVIWRKHPWRMDGTALNIAIGRTNASPAPMMLQRQSPVSRRMQCSGSDDLPCECRPIYRSSRSTQETRQVRLLISFPAWVPRAGGYLLHIRSLFRNRRLCFRTKGSDSHSKLESLFFLILIFLLLILNIYLFIYFRSIQNQIRIKLPNNAVFDYVRNYWSAWFRFESIHDRNIRRFMF